MEQGYDKSMATTRQLLTLEEFHQQFDGKKPYYEFRRGEAIQKSMPTWLHNLLEHLLVDIFGKAGYQSGHEIELRVNDHWHPIPDVIAHPHIQDPYPTTPVDVVVEILSPRDEMIDAIDKCADYQSLGIPAIFVLDPIHNLGWQWIGGKLEAISSLVLPNGASIELISVWAELQAPKSALIQVAAMFHVKRSVQTQINIQNRHRRRRHPRYPTRLSQSLRPHPHQLLLHLIR